MIIVYFYLNIEGWNGFIYNGEWFVLVYWKMKMFISCVIWKLCVD